MSSKDIRDRCVESIMSSLSGTRLMVDAFVGAALRDQDTLIVRLLAEKEELLKKLEYLTDANCGCPPEDEQ